MTDEKIRRILFTGAAVARGVDPDTFQLDDDEHRARIPGEWCGCGHHRSTHHGVHGDGPCADCNQGLEVGCWAFKVSS